MIVINNPVSYRELLQKLGAETCVAILRAVAGAGNVLDAAKEADPALVLRFLEEHRVVGRALSIMQADRIDDHPLSRSLDQAFAETLVTYKQDRELLTNFVNEYLLSDEILVLKSSYAATVYGVADLVEPNNDIDFMVRRPTELLKKLKADGLISTDADWPDPSHEISVFKYEGRKMELHRCIPLWSPLVSDGVACVDRGRRTVVSRTRYDGAGIETLGANPIPVKLTGIARCYYLNPSRQMLTIIGSRYEDACLYAHSGVLRPPIRLSELLEVREIITRHIAALSEFAALVVQFNFEKPAIWFAEAMHYWLGDDALLKSLQHLSFQAQDGRSVPKLLAGGSWVDVPYSPGAELLGHPTTADVLELIAEPQSEPLCLQDGRSIAAKLNGPTGLNLSIGHTAIEDLAVNLLLDGANLTLTLPIAGDIALSQEYRVYVEVNSWMHEFFANRHTGLMQLRKSYRPWAEGHYNKYTQTDDSFVVTLDLRPYLRGSREPQVCVILGLGVPQFPRDTDRGWIYGTKFLVPNSLLKPLE